MARLGSWTTYDTPTEHQAEAIAWVAEQFAKIGGNVRKVSNPHEFGAYESIEIDLPAKFEDCDLIDDCDCTEAEADHLAEFEKWQDQANAIESEYSKKFGEWL